MKIFFSNQNINFGANAKHQRTFLNKDNEAVDCFVFTNGRVVRTDGRFFYGTMKTKTADNREVELTYDNGAVVESKLGDRLIKTFENTFTFLDKNFPNSSPTIRTIKTHKYNDDGELTNTTKTDHFYFNNGKIKKVEAEDYEARYDANGTLSYEYKVSPFGEFTEMDATYGGNRNSDGSYILKKGIITEKGQDVQDVKWFDRNGQISKTLECKTDEEAKTLIRNTYLKNGELLNSLTIKFDRTPKKGISYTYLYNPNEITQCTIDASLDNFSYKIDTKTSDGEIMELFKREEYSQEYANVLREQVSQAIEDAIDSHIDFPYEAHEIRFYKLVRPNIN